MNRQPDYIQTTRLTLDDKSRDVLLMGFLLSGDRRYLEAARQLKEHDEFLHGEGTNNPTPLIAEAYKSSLTR